MSRRNPREAAINLSDGSTVRVSGTTVFVTPADRSVTFQYKVPTADVFRGFLREVVMEGHKITARDLSEWMLRHNLEQLETLGGVERHSAQRIKQAKAWLQKHICDPKGIDIEDDWGFVNESDYVDVQRKYQMAGLKGNNPRRNPMKAQVSCHSRTPLSLVRYVQKNAPAISKYLYDLDHGRKLRVPPPPGFDKRYKLFVKYFVMLNDVPLFDEN